MNPLLLGIFLSTLFSMVKPCRVLVIMYYFVCVVIIALYIRDLCESANNIINSFVFRLFDENMHCTANFLFELIMIKNNRLCIGLNDDLFSYDELQTNIDFVCTFYSCRRTFALCFCLFAEFLYFDRVRYL